MKTTSTLSGAPPGHISGARGGKYLSFQLGREEYAIRVLQVREIVKMQHITSVPDTPHSVKGVINLRGKVIPVVDLRLKFGLPELEYGQRTCIIVIDAYRNAASLVGIIVDEVSEVLNLQEGDIQDTPDFGVETSYLLGMAKVKDKVKLLLDIEQALKSYEAIAAATIAQ
jgi:purine-binding chemotaxis protein CheW